ncbi:hypothetical protein OXYTRIMIC_280 [Oxytricha trifallax]|uniref:Uncharacterized protein n=1 Tax=Oxytricha trifallax TaxID=1172189 RepID=A0A073I153_9SPIT|nr:hypothetical protein OXYTRIMIC_280 [Oxytricha trifallax]
MTEDLIQKDDFMLELEEENEQVEGRFIEFGEEMTVLDGYTFNKDREINQKEGESRTTIVESSARSQLPVFKPEESEQPEHGDGERCRV